MRTQALQDGRQKLGNKHKKSWREESFHLQFFEWRVNATTIFKYKVTPTFFSDSNQTICSSLQEGLNPQKGEKAVAPLA